MTACAFDPLSGRGANLRYEHSPHQDERPYGNAVELIVIHAISLPPRNYGTGCVHDLFLNRLAIEAHPYFSEIRDRCVSAHFFIERNGDITQFVSVLNRAWHAGESSYRGRAKCNDFSIGVELEGCDEEPFETVQYVRLSWLIRGLRDAFPALTRHCIVAHSDIAPARKTDPGPYFDWVRLFTLLDSMA